MKIIKLTPPLAARVANLDASLSLPCRLTLKEIISNLKDVELNNCNYSYALMDNKNNMLGYVSAWLTDSQFVIDDTVVFIDGLAILPKYEEHKVNLIKTIVKSLEEQNLKGTAIEATLLEEESDKWLDDISIEEEVGYVLTETHDYRDETLQEYLYWLDLSLNSSFRMNWGS